jgi:sodium-dependent phosphate cotransporter
LKNKKLGSVLTMLVQSSSVFTSTLTPLVGMGLVSLERVYPLTLGANIGTTVTGILASVSGPAKTLKFSLQIALCHTLFNIGGILLWYPIPYLRRWPILMAQFLGDKTANYRWFAIFYLIVLFFMLPITIFALSLLGM